MLQLRLKKREDVSDNLIVQYIDILRHELFVLIDPID